MGILNVTPDSFSDGGELADDPSLALARAYAMVEAGAALLDVGGESTRPGAALVGLDEELRRVLPVIEALARELPVPISVDTRKAAVASAALAAGAAVVNDVSALAHDPAMGEVAARAGAGLVLMHMRGEPSTMMEHARYGDLMREVARELEGAIAKARAAGVSDAAIVVDPGVGFAKTAEQNLTLIRRLAELTELGRPILVGPSRKSFLGRILDVPPEERVAGTVAACVAAYVQGARIFRVHDVLPVVQALRVAEAIARESIPEPQAAPLGAGIPAERGSAR
jgi:dihydropteroate synthase